MTAKDYPVTFPYGATSKPYSVSHPHRGDDRACPEGTLIVISNTTIGKTGNTGLSTGAHLHIQEWQISYDNTRNPQNEFKPGTVIDVGIHPQFGNYISIKNKDGWVTTYAHLSSINVTKGQVIGEDMATDKQVDEWISLFHQEAYGKPPTDDVFKSWRPVLKNNFIEGSLSIMKGTDTNPGALKNQPKSYAKVTETLYRKNA